MFVTKKDGWVILAVSGVLLFAGTVGKWWIGKDAFIIVIMLSNIFILSGLFEVYRRLHKRDDELKRLLLKSTSDASDNYRQIESLFSIISCIKPNLPLPDTRGWSASPDFLKKIIEVICREKPKFVVEASSGVSSLIIAYCLKQIGSGKLLSLEHEAK